MNTLPQLNGDANHPAHPDTLQMARVYARAGARVLPLRAKSKAAILNDWPNNATTNADQITKWFGNGTAHNVGLAMGTWAHTATDQTYLVCIDIDMHGDTNGIEAWQKLVADNGGNFGQPFIADTATGGLHLLFACPIALTNERGALPSGIDVRGQGGYIMTEPSTHPDNGRAPKWRAGSSWPTAKPGLMPQWLLDIVQTKPEPIQRTATTEPRLRALGEAPRPGDTYNNTHTWENELTKNGWQFNGTKSDEHGHKSVWVRPGKSATPDAQSAVLAHDEGENGVLTIFSANAPRELLRSDHTTTTGGHYKFTSPFDFYTCMHHNGDHKQAAQMYGAELRTKQQPDIDRLMGTANKPQLSVVNTDKQTAQIDEPESGHTWVLRDMSELIGVPYEPRLPELLFMNNGRGLMYQNAHNMAAGPSGSMKTWLQALNTLQQIQRGKHVVIIDYEMQMHDWFNRLTLLGATNAELDLVHYCAPDEAITAMFMGAPTTTAAAQKMRSEIARISELPGGLSLVVIDGVTNAMTQNNLKLLDNMDTARFWQLLPSEIVRLTGAGVVLNDHQAKGAGDNPTPLGAQHKIANISGAAHMLKAEKFLARWPILNEGVVRFNCIKDRYGEIGQGQRVAQAIFTPLDNGKIAARIEPYTGEHEMRASNTDRALLDTIKQIADTNQRVSVRAIHKIVGGSRENLTAKLQTMAANNLARNCGTDTNPDWQVIDNSADTDLAELF